MSSSKKRNLTEVNTENISNKRSRKDEIFIKDEKKDQTEINKTGDTILKEESKEMEDSSESSETDSFIESSDDEYVFEEEMEYNIKDELEMLKEKDPEIFKKLEDITSEIEKTEPNVMELLNIPLRLEDRAKLCQFYEIYKSQIPNTYEWLETRSKYNNLLKEYKISYSQYIKFSEEEHIKMEEEEKKFRNYNTELCLKYKILSLKTSDNNKSIIYKRYQDLKNFENSNEEYSKLKHWIKWVTDIPHDKIKEIKVKNISEFIKKASEKLDKELFGMKKVKEQILLFLTAKLYNPNNKRNNIGLVGPPGVGKTAISRLISEIMEWGFEQISFGGIDKPDFLKGHDYTYIGAQPGEIVKCLKRMGHKNGVIFLDEFEKISENPDIKSALLHLIDQSQNHEFKDNFLGEITLDLSYIWFIASMNNIPKDKALADRWWIIKVDGYDNIEKFQILKNYLIPKTLKNIGLKEKDISFKDETLKDLIENVYKSEDKGVRTLQKYINDLLNKIHFINIHQDKKGKLQFETSFNIDYKINYPIIFDIKMLKNFIENKKLDIMLTSMYI
jgi:ATP-dependent Lon protease